MECKRRCLRSMVSLISVQGPERTSLFSGLFPGPTIEVRSGDLLVVNVYNKLSEATSLHWHGIRHPAGPSTHSHVPLHLPNSRLQVTTRKMGPRASHNVQYLLVQITPIIYTFCRNNMEPSGEYFDWSPFRFSIS